jgi:aminoglycoside phosphotransferase (APT) family kinase protein
MHDPEAMPQRLAAFLTEHDGRRTAEVTSYEAMVGGYSRLMARADVRWSDGSTEVLVLRGDPPPGKSMAETDRDAEHLLLRALGDSGAIPTPRVRAYDDQGDRLGTKCIVIEFVHGQPLQTLLGAADDLAHGSYADALVDSMAAVHSIDPDVVADVLPRPADWDTYIRGLIDRFRSSDQQHVESMPVLRYVAAWLESHLPPPLPLRVVHSDFQPANIMVDASGTHQMVDWEFAHIGDPREDLGYYNVYAAALGPNLFARDPERFLARYRERTGFGEDAVNMQTMAFFSSLAAISVYSQILGGAAAMARGQNSGLMTTYTLNALTVGHSNFLAGCSTSTEPETR